MGRPATAKATFIFKLESKSAKMPVIEVKEVRED